MNKFICFNFWALLWWAVSHCRLKASVWSLSVLTYSSSSHPSSSVWWALARIFKCSFVVKRIISPSLRTSSAFTTLSPSLKWDTDLNECWEILQLNPCLQYKDFWLLHSWRLPIRSFRTFEHFSSYALFIAWMSVTQQWWSMYLGALMRKYFSDLSDSSSPTMVNV